MNHNGPLARAVLRRLHTLGVTRWVVCAGARNLPLVHEVLRQADAGKVFVWHHFDERTAAFFALGLAKKDHRPVAVLTTSGTAAAELLPAMVEAYYAGIPLVVVTADRPHRFQGSGAPQAIEQAGLFGCYAVASKDVAQVEDLGEAERLPWNAPSHWNVRFEEPSEQDSPADDVDPWDQEPSLQEHSVSASGDLAQREAWQAFLNSGDGAPLILLGELPEAWRAPVEQWLVHSSSVAIWAEATSGLRESETLRSQLVYNEKSLCLAGGVRDKVIRIGGVPSLRLWRDLEETDRVPVFSLSPLPFSGLARPSGLWQTETFPDLPPLTGGTAIPPEDATGLDRFPLAEPTLLRRLAERVSSSALLFLGNSLVIREWNLAAPVCPPHARCYANRGANGIDGEVATFLGLSVGEEEAWGIFGDLTALYDLNAPSLVDQFPAAKRRIVILNNGGGKIFARLKSFQNLPDSTRSVVENRHRTPFRAWAELWGWEYVCWTGQGPFPELEGDRIMIELVPDAEQTQAFWDHV